MGDWVFEHLGWFVFLAAFALVGLLVVAVIGEVMTQSKFMEGCMKERAEYECTAMWRGAQPQIIPVMIPVR